MTPLMKAARDGQREIVEQLLEMGADVNETNKVSLFSTFIISRSYKRITPEFTYLTVLEYL